MAAEPFSLTALFDGFYKFAKFLGVFRSAWTYASKELAVQDVYDVANLADKAFGGELSPKQEVRLFGILSPYLPSSRQPVYTPYAVGPAKETIVQERIINGRIDRQVKLETGGYLLAPPLAKIADVKLPDGRGVGLAWLYPESCSGLILPKRGANESGSTDPDEAFEIDGKHQPIPVLYPLNADYSAVFHRRVEVRGTIVSVPPTAVSPIVDSLDGITLAVLGNCTRPFEAGTSLIAIDVTEGKVTPGGPVSEWRAVISVQGVVDTKPLTSKEQSDALFNAVIDAIPDRVGMGPMRMINYGQDAGGVFSAGRIRWLYRRDLQTIGAFSEIDLMNRADTAEKTAELTAHWHAWSKTTRYRTQPILREFPTIRPVSVWDPSRLSLFQAGGYSLPKSIERALASKPEARAGVDWLRVAVGRPSKD